MRHEIVGVGGFVQTAEGAWFVFLVVDGNLLDSSEGSAVGTDVAIDDVEAGIGVEAGEPVVGSEAVDGGGDERSREIALGGIDVDIIRADGCGSGIHCFVGKG